MSKTIIVNGYGPGISSAVAEKFGREGFAVALVARNALRLGAGVKALEALVVRAAAFPTDLGDADAARGLVPQVRSALGPITAIHWNAYSGAAGDLSSASAAEIRSALEIATTSLLSVVQAALPDLRAQPGAAVLVTNGSLGLLDPKIDAMAVQWNAMGLALANAAKNKLVGLLAEKLKADNIYVAQVLVGSLVKGTAFDNGSATLEPAVVANKFWELYAGRTQLSVELS